MMHSGLVIAAARGRRFGARLLLRNTDWELIRQCPVPLLLVKSPRPYRRPLVLAAVDPFHKHARPADLDAQLLEMGRELARLLRGSLHVFHAYMPVIAIEPVAIAAAPLVLMPPEAEEAHAQQVRRTIGQLADRAGIPPGRCHIRMGEVASQLAAFARRNGAAIVVMGAVSRSAIMRLFIGSAAERTLDLLGCDVLVVKPRSFRSSVQKRAATNTRSRMRRRSRSSVVGMQAVPLPLL